MWLLDANPDIHLLELLHRLGIDCDTAEIADGRHCAMAISSQPPPGSGFDKLLTRDQPFAESFSRAWRTFSHLRSRNRNAPAVAIRSLS
jgi:hypothetical protein